MEGKIVVCACKFCWAWCVCAFVSTWLLCMFFTLKDICLMKIKIIIFKLIIIDLFTQGSFVAQPNHFCYNAATTLLWLQTLHQGYECWEKEIWLLFLVRGEIDKITHYESIKNTELPWTNLVQAIIMVNFWYTYFMNIYV